MKLTAVVLWVGSVCCLLAWLGLIATDHGYLAGLAFLVAAIAAPTGLIVYCIGQATEILLDRIDQRAKELQVGPDTHAQV